MDKLDEAWAESVAVQPAPEVLEALRLCIAKLKPKAQMTLKLRYFEGGGLSGKEIGERIGSKPNAVYVALSRIHKALLACMARRTGLRPPGIESESADGTA